MKVAVSKINAAPHKRSILSIVADYDLTKSICELVDNAIDIWTKTSKKKPLLVDIDFDQLQKTITITDNAGGVDERHLEYLVSLGATGNLQDDPTIGIFGVGTKRAVIALSEDVRIVTRSGKKDTFLIEFDHNWLNDDDWHLPYFKVDGIKEGTTIIELRKLLISIESIDLKILCSNLETIYSRFLDHDQVMIKLDGKPLVAKQIENWAYPPSYRPRRYVGQLNTKEGRKVSVEVKAGLSTESSPTKGEWGVYFFCNDRLIANALKIPEVGFIKGIAGQPHPSLSILKIVISLQGVAADMPWNSSKSSINPNHYIFQALRSWMFEIVRNFSSLSRRLESYWAEDVFKYTSGEFVDVSVPDFSITSKSYLLELPAVNERYVDVVKHKNVTVQRKKPWTKGITDAIVLVNYIQKQKVETKSRASLLLLDANLEIAFKEYLVNDSGKYYSDGDLSKMFKQRHLVENEIKIYIPTTAITVDEWKKIRYYYDLRCKFIHQRATATVTESDLEDFQKIVNKVLKVLFNLRF